MADAANPVQVVEEPQTRNWLAFMVFFVAAGGILAASIIAIVSTNDFKDKIQIFNIIVPVFSTWVGTILAYYFAKDNLDSANRNVQQLLTRLTPEQRLQQTQASSVMTSRADIKGVTLPDPGGEASILVSDLVTLGEGVSRIPIFLPNGSVKYVLHSSVLQLFLGKDLKAGAANVVATQQNQAAMTLEQLLTKEVDQNGAKATIGQMAKRFAVVKTDANLADARSAMLAVTGARDVFVTSEGKAADPVVGWLTDTIITREINVA